MFYQHDFMKQIILLDQNKSIAVGTEYILKRITNGDK